MIDAVILDALVKSGASAEMIAAAVKADNDKQISRLISRRMKDAERKREQRAREAASAMSRGHDVTDADSSGQGVTPRDTFPPDKESPPTPPKEINPLTKENPSLRDGQKKGTRLSKDWAPNEENRDDALRVGVPRERITIEADKFRDHWISKPGREGCKLDWDATWRNWCRNIRAPPGNVASFNGNRNTGHARSTSQIARELSAEFKRHESERGDGDPFAPPRSLPGTR